MMRKQKVLVTGAAGFIGSQLCERLMKKGYDCRGIDNMNSHLYDPILKAARVQEMKLNLDVVDIRDFDQFAPKIVNFNPDVVVHLAALPGVRDSFGKEPEYHSNNIDGTQSLIEACKLLEDPPKVIYASTEPASSYEAQITVSSWGFSATTSNQIVLDTRGEAVICIWDGNNWFPISNVGATLT